MLALTVLFTALAAERLLPGRTAVARTGALLVALSPFLIAHAGAFMSHTTAAAFGAIAIWCAARSDDGTPWWMAGAGVAIGAMFATRPVSALTLAAGISFWSALRAARTDQLALRRSAGRIALFAAGALPFVALVALYNSHFFGSATTFGYNAALGQAAGLGFGTDPWGNTYGPLQALAYTSAELSALNLFLLETPLPAVAIVALYLVLAPRLARGETLIAAWALLPVAAQLPYWHHGLFMGPRMLNESAPAWALLAAIAVVALVARLPARLPASPGWSPRTFGATLALGAVLAGVFVLGPMRLSSYTQRPLAFDAASSAQAPALIFVHGGWTSRLAMRLAAAGMRLDSVETALRQNPTCAVQTYADARRAGSPLPALDFAPRATALPQAVELSPGNRIRIAAGETRLAGECGRQAAADRNGVIDVTPLLWRGDLPGAPVSGAMFVRDMGPPDNETIIAAEPARTAYILMTAAPDAPPRLLPYAEGVRLLWGANREGA
jgi:hypothetical protein